MSPGRTNPRKRVVALKAPNYIGDEYLSTFCQDYDFSILGAENREQAKKLLLEDIAKNGPIDAFIVVMGTPHFEPFNKNLLQPLTPDCKIITSASAGYNEFAVDWMASEGITFCNTVDAVAEATADMAMFLTLSALRNAGQAERSARAGTWRGGLVPARDPSGLVLGIIGMGSIGKVGSSNTIGIGAELT